MSRNQSERYWVQTELNPKGQTTGFVHLDLSMVDSVTYNFEPDGETIDLVQIVTGALIKPLTFKGEQARWLAGVWSEYVKIQRTAPRAKPGLLVAPEQSGVLKV